MNATTRLAKITALDPFSLRAFALSWIPALIWTTLVTLQHRTIDPICQKKGFCNAEHINSVDQIAVRLDDPRADVISTVTQNTVGIGAPLIAIGLSTLGGIAMAHPASRVASLAMSDLHFFLRVSFGTAASTELFKQIFSRPRPYVYRDPETYGENSMNYTSFYSGHSAWAASAAFASLMIMISRGLTLNLLFFYISVAYSLVGMTLWGRVASGRHFPTDVVVGFFAGSLIAWLFCFLHSRKGITQ